MNAVSILGAVAAFSAFFLSAIVWCVRKGFVPCRRELKNFGLLSAIEKFLIVLFVVGWMVFGGSKNDSTNSPPLGMMGPPMTMAEQSPNVVISETETNVGYRVESVVDGDGIVPLVNATTNDLWRLRGGMADARRMENGKWKTANSVGDDSVAHWYFPYRDTFTEGLTVFANGEFRPNVKTTYFPKPFDAVLSLVPQGKWGQVANGGPSLFTHELTPSNSLMLSWQNALYNRDANCPTNFQAELFADGRFEYRYPDHTTRYAPVFPFDWDGDGLENSVDPEPFSAGPDAHGTNAEWYNRVCGNVFAATPGVEELELAPRTVDVNTNAYYFVDVVSECLGPIYFCADGESDLGNPVVIARAGETCRVPLLIGATYCVSSSVPFQVFAPMEAVLQVRPVPGNVRVVNWPVPVSFTTVDGWTRPSVPEDLQRRLGGVFSWSDGCCMLVAEEAVAFQCHGCRCRGCSAFANYSYSGYHLTCPGASCGCNGESGNHEGYPFVETPSGARLSIRFDKRALLFENAYDDSPGVTVARRSSPVSLTVEAAGGLYGGTLSFSPQNFDLLTRAAGDALPTSPVLLTSGTNISSSATYEALAPSDAADDISLTVRLEEGGNPPLVIDCTIRLTAVELSLTADKFAPENKCPHRHGYGVRERVKAEQRPSYPRVEWRAPDWIVTNGSPASLVCPLVATNRGGVVQACLEDAEYLFDVSVYNPTGVFSRVGEAQWFYRPRFPGQQIPLGCPGTGMRVPVYVGPMEVSFEGIAIAELVCNTGTHSGYFDNPLLSASWSHSFGNGAGWYYPVKSGNLWFTDEPQMGLGTNNPPITAGTLCWDIPIGWNEIGTKRGWPCACEIPSDEVEQVFVLESNGTLTLSKFGQWTSRTTNDCRVVNGVIVKQGE